MQVSLETTSELSRKMTIQVPEEHIQERVDSRLKALSQRVRVDGFRPGKVPPGVIRKRYGQQVREEVLAELIQTSFQEAVRDSKLRPAGVPQIQARKMGEGEGLEYEANFEVLPDFVPMPLETLAVKRYVSEVTEEDVDAMVQRLREQRKTWRAVARPAGRGDRAVVAFEGWDGEQSFTGGRVNEFPVIIGSGMMIPGFEDRLVGAEAGARLEFELAFPADYPGGKMAGKTGRFQVEVLRVEESVVPELDAEFIQSFGIEDGDLERFRADIRSNLEREMQRALRAKTKASVMDALYAANPIALPGTLVEDELDSLLAPYREAARTNQQPLDEAKLKQRLEPVARRRVALALVLGKLIDAHGLVVNPERVRATVEELAASYEDSEAVVRWYYAAKERLREVENLTMEDQIVDLVLEKATTSEEHLQFRELLQPATDNPQPPLEAQSK
ncbi:trigger factor [Candidatus Methylocalor cossyra]|uniref:Trigger factor n=1 Tax=Candidatus Methylocalor cossyra TaxID=3108543 RepID=A0ABP1C730_9GAMM